MAVLAVCRVSTHSQCIYCKVKLNSWISSNRDDIQIYHTVNRMRSFLSSSHPVIWTSPLGLSLLHNLSLSFKIFVEMGSVWISTTFIRIKNIVVWCPVIWRGWVLQWGPQLGLYIISPYFGYNCRVFAAHHYQLSPSQDSAVELLNFDIILWRFYWRLKQVVSA